MGGGGRGPIATCAPLQVAPLPQRDAVRGVESLMRGYDGRCLLAHLVEAPPTFSAGLPLLDTCCRGDDISDGPGESMRRWGGSDRIGCERAALCGFAISCRDFTGRHKLLINRLLG